MNKTSSSSFFENLLTRTGGRYPILMLLALQMITTPIFILLTAMPSQDNANFSTIQGRYLLVFGGVALLIRNVLLIVQFIFHNKDLITQLSILSQPEVVIDDPEREKRAWEQANSASKGYMLAEFISLLIFVLPLTLAFGYFNLHLSKMQIIYLGLGMLPAGLVIFIFGYVTLEQILEPVLQVSLPKQFETQLIGLKGLRLWVKLSFALIGLVLIGLLLTVPTAYHQVNILINDPSRSPQLVSNALVSIVNANIGAIVIGLLLSYRLVSYFSIPFGEMINLFKEIETGNLSRRIKVPYSDEFGKVNIYLNHMIERLQIMTSTLEQKVTDRTTQLSKTNEQLQIELAERMQVEKQLEHASLHDPLTNLPNRALFMDRLYHVLERAKRHKNFSFAVIFIDLDHFKVVNDSLGHDVGDLLLKETARRLTNCVRSEDTVARLGGDEFVILLEELDYPTDYIQVAERIQRDIAEPENLQGYIIFMSLSMGIVVGNSRYEQPEDIVRDADIAMYQAKKQGRGRYEVFIPKMLEGAMSRLEMETELRKALEKQEFLIHYQPILDLETRCIVGFEALLRWQHPTRGVIPAMEFISLAEEIGLIVPIGYWALDKACHQLRAWQAQYPSEPPLTVHVNISTRQFAEKDLFEKIVEILQKNQLDASHLKLELTESLIVENSEQTSTILSKFRNIGIQVYIAEFGSGYTSLGHKHSSLINTLKIGRNFISQMETNSRGSEIVQTILTLAHSLGMKVIAEGVETDDQLSKLKAMNCEYAQGFLIAKPLNSQEADAFLGKSLTKDKS